MGTTEEKSPGTNGSDAQYIYFLSDNVRLIEADPKVEVTPLVRVGEDLWECEVRIPRGKPMKSGILRDIDD